MKILAGAQRGHSFLQPPTSGTRPLSDKVRAAIFDVYGSVEARSVLDVYAGSGAAGFEALSRGASQVEAIEANARVGRVIEQNAVTLGYDWGYSLRIVTLASWLARPGNEPTPRYDLIIADPPYASLEPDLLERLIGFLVADGVLVVSHTSKQTSPHLAAAELVKAKVYGDTALSFYCRPAA
ncbi:RsmD family RNA methyltransferase [Candidatus Saccharibacteria bacterium]|nr:RsmD family RNA methyltransferase [Candidatus Saccharibacteria bacterium]